MPRNFNNDYDYYGDDFGNIGNTFGDRFEQEAKDDRPTQLQQLYGSRLPPSLRYGALSQTVPAASSKTRSRTRGSGRFDNANNNDGLFRNNYLEPQWNVQTTGGRLESMRNRKYDFDDDVVSIGSGGSQRRRPAFGTRPLGRKTRFEPDPLGELGRLEAEELQMEAERERMKQDQRAGDEVVIDFGPGHRLSPTVEEDEEKEEEDADDEDQEEEEEADEVEEKKEKIDADNDVDNSSTTEEVIGLHTPGAIKRPQPPRVYEEVGYFGPPPEGAGEADIKPFPQVPRANPVYPKVHRKYLSRHTLRFYDLPWEYERGDRNWIIILQEMDKDETEILFDHTKQWRRRRNLDAEQASSDSESGFDSGYRRGRTKRGSIFGEVDSDSDLSERESVVTETKKPFLVFDFDPPINGVDETPGSEHAPQDQAKEQKIQPGPAKSSQLSGSTLDCVFNAGYDTTNKGIEFQGPNPGRIEIVPPGPVSSTNALFHLRHMQQETLDFEKFKKAVLSIRELQNVRNVVHDHLKYVQKKFEHLSDFGNMGRHLEPFVNQYSHKVRNYGNLAITTMCVPFICLGKNRHENIARLSLRSLLRMTHEDTSRSTSISDDFKPYTAHPTRTLFQSLYAKSDSRRDLNQAICHVLDQQQGRYLYVSQLWALIIDKEVLITCSTLSKKELFGDVIATQPNISEGQCSMTEKTHIRAETPDGSIWNFNQAECRTYFDFVAHFSQYTTTFATESEIVFNGEVIKPSQWPEILAAAQNSTVTIKLRRIPMIFDEDGFDKVIIPETVESTLIRMMFGLVPELSQTQMDAARSVMNAALAPPRSDSYVSKEHPDISDSEKKDNFSAEDAAHRAADQDSANGKRSTETLDRHLLVLGSFVQAVQQRPQGSAILVPSTAEIETGLPKFTLDNFNFNPASFADEDELFNHCGEVTPQTFIDSLNALIPQWFAVEDKHESENPSSKNSTGRVRSEDNISLDQWRSIALATLHNGLRSLVSLFSLQQLEDRPSGKAFRKLLQAILLVSTAFHELVPIVKTFPKPKQKSIYRHVLGLDNLFRATTELEVYSITYEAMLGRMGAAADDYLRLVKHCTTALLIAARVAREHVLLGPRLEKDLGQRTDQTRSRLIDELNVTIGVVDRTMGRRHHRSQAKTTTAQNPLEREADVLSKEGWDRDVALTVLKTHFGELRVSHHAKLSSRAFKRTFDKALRANPNKTISNKAAALPLDVVNILLPRILHMPVYENQDTLHMYNHYLTELESNILTGEASREPLERLRYLKHELNAFSIIQNQQLSLLEDLKEPMFSDAEPIFESRSLDRIPHPGPHLLDKTIKYLELQNTNIKGLDVLIDTLQGEAQAAIVGIQDWRDNAAVVFTVITIIFLPLSFVASVLGMNTSEIRSMNLNQWVFWASAIPFTLLVICVTLYFVEVPPLRRWLERKGVLGHRKR